MVDRLSDCVAVYPMAEGLRRLLVRGLAEVRIEPTGDVVRGAGLPTWTERVLRAHEAIVVSTAAERPAAGVPAPIPAVAHHVLAPAAASRRSPLAVPARVAELVASSVGFDDSWSLSRPVFLEDSWSHSGSTAELRTAGGQSVLLDRSVIIGRAPHADADAASVDAPRLVTIVGRGPDVSRNHVRVDVESGGIVLTDLASRNGTAVTLPGRRTVRLRSGERARVSPGTVIDLGSGVRFTVGKRR